MQVSRSFLRPISLAKGMLLKRSCSHSPVVVSELVEKSNYLFSEEQKRQMEEVGRIEKINVEVLGPPENLHLVMNKSVSTPYDCARHISQGLVQQTPLAVIDKTVLWDMHRPLPEDCQLQFLNFKDKDPYSLNMAFWRTGSFVLGAVIKRVFKDDVIVHLHSFPPPYIKSGSFVYDVFMNLECWQPSESEMRILSAEFLTFVSQNHKIERLMVKKSVAMDIFEGSPFKQQQIPEIAVNSPDHLVTLYRVGDHIDISKGPMIANTSFFGRCFVASVHRVSFPGCDLYRFQAVALPKGIMLNSTAFGILVNRAARLNESNVGRLTDRELNFYTGPDSNPNSQIKVNDDMYSTERPLS